MTLTVSKTTTKYFQFHQFFFNLGGSSLFKRSFLYRIYHNVGSVIYTSYIFILGAGILQVNFNENLDAWFYLMATSLSATLAWHTNLNKRQIREVILNFEEDQFSASTKRGGKEEETKVLSKWLSMNKTQCLFFVGCGSVSFIGQVSYSLYTRLSSNDYHNWKIGFAESAIIFNVTYSPNYEIVWVYQTVAYFFLLMNATCAVTLATGSVSFVGIQFTLLQMYLRRISRLARQKRTDELGNSDDLNQSDLRWYVDDAIKYHADVIQLANNVISVFNDSALIIFGFSLAIICISVYRASMHVTADLHQAIIWFEVISGAFPLTIICFYGENLRKDSEGVADAAYEIEFVGADLDIQKSIILLIENSQAGTKLKAGNFSDASLSTLVSVMRGSFSAYMMLRTVNSKNLIE